MSLEKKDLADLYSLYMKFLSRGRLEADIDKFVKSETVAVFRRNEEDLRNLESAHLPEITSLICHSRPGLLGEKFEKYRLISPLYRSNKTEVLSATLNISIDDFKRGILPYIDEYSAKSLCSYFDQQTKNIEEIGIKWKKANDNLRKISEEIEKIEQDLKEATDNLEEIQRVQAHAELVEFSENNETEQKIALDSMTIYKDDTLTDIPESSIRENVAFKEDETGKPKEESTELKVQKGKEDKINKKLKKKLKKKEEIKSLCKELQKKEDLGYKELDRLEPYIELVKQILLTYDSEVSEHRKECYEYFNRDVYKKEKDAVALLTSDITLEVDVIDNIKKAISLSTLLELLSKGFYPSKEIMIIGKLIDYEIVDYNDDMIKHFLENNTKLLLDYLLENFSYSVNQVEQISHFKNLFDFAVIYDKGASKMEFNDLWDEIDSADIWKYLSTIVADEMDLARYVTGVRGRSLRSFIEYLEMDDISIPDFVQAVSKQDEVNVELLCRIIQNYDKQLNKLSRELRRANKRLEKQEGDSVAKVFSAMYGPMEKLETLACDIKLYDGAIKKRIIATQLMECVDKFRKGLEELEVFPMESFDVWKFQKPVAYNNSIHRYKNGKAKQSKQVTVKTLGFRYETADASGNGETEERIEYAKVVPVIPIKEG